jgi:hypothetical protein
MISVTLWWGMKASLRRHGHQAVIHDFEVKALQVRDVARNVEGEDLPFSVFRRLIPTSEAFDDEAALRWSITLLDDVLVWTNGLRAKR